MGILRNVLVLQRNLILHGKMCLTCAVLFGNIPVLHTCNTPDTNFKLYSVELFCENIIHIYFFSLPIKGGSHDSDLI